MRYRARWLRRYFRADAAFAMPEVYEFLEAESFRYAIRLPANRVLQQSIAHLLRRPVGRPPKEVRRYHASFSYQAQSWTKPRRVVAKVEWHPGELYPRVGFIVTNLARPAERVVAFYNQRGTAEQHIKEGKHAIKWTRLSCRRFRHNAVRLQLHVLAYNLGNFLRTLALPEAVEQWSLTTLREKLVKIGAKQDRREDRAPRTLRHIPIGRGRDPTPVVRRDPEADRPAQTEATPNMMKVQPLKLPSDGTGVSVTQPERSYPAPRWPITTLCRSARPDAARPTPIWLYVKRDWGTITCTAVSYGKCRLNPPFGLLGLAPRPDAMFAPRLGPGEGPLERTRKHEQGLSQRVHGLAQGRRGGGAWRRSRIPIPPARQPRDLAALHRHQRMGAQAVRLSLGEVVAVDGQRAARRVITRRLYYVW